MTTRSIIRAESLSDDGFSFDSASGRGDEKTIPFLRRLCDMLVENKDVISFAPGHRNGGHNILGRIVVHDRIQVEVNVLPRYFNHSSFASLRRQLNYFSFVRMGKGRQRESTYVNDNVVELDDILQLKRRSGGVCGASTIDESDVIPLVPSKSSSSAKAKAIRSKKQTLKIYHGSKIALEKEPSSAVLKSAQRSSRSPVKKVESVKKRQVKRIRRGLPLQISKKQPRFITPKPSRLASDLNTHQSLALSNSNNNINKERSWVSEDEQSEGSCTNAQSVGVVSLDLTRTLMAPQQLQHQPCHGFHWDLSQQQQQTDEEILAGCTALLGLAGRRCGWGMK